MSNSAASTEDNQLLTVHGRQFFATDRQLMEYHMLQGSNLDYHTMPSRKQPLHIYLQDVPSPQTTPPRILEIRRLILRDKTQPNLFYVERKKHVPFILACYSG